MSEPNIDMKALQRVLAQFPEGTEGHLVGMALQEPEETTLDIQVEPTRFLEQIRRVEAQVEALA